MSLFISFVLLLAGAKVENTYQFSEYDLGSASKKKKIHDIEPWI
jgi:hypothetical protein